MPRSAQYITIEGQFASSVLGTFRIIRGFANLQDLAAMSAPYEMTQPGDAGPLQGHQRAIRVEHAEEIKRYLQDGKLRFIPEIILSVRAAFRDELDEQQRPIGVIANAGDGIRVRRRWRSRNIKTHEIRVSKHNLADLLTAKRIRRIDGNHRLHLAGQLAQDPHVPTKYLAPFCAVLLGPPGDANDDYVESMLFHTINYTAERLDSEHALTLLLNQNPGFGQTTDEEFATSPAIFLTRLLKRKMDGLPAPQRERIGTRPATVIFDSARSMIDRLPTLKATRETAETFATDLCAAANDILSRLPVTMPLLCKSEFFLELVSLAWSDAPGANHDDKVNAAVKTLESMGYWLGRDGLQGIQQDGPRSFAQQLFELHRAVRNRIPKRVFLARWYPLPNDGDERTKADLRKQMIDRALNDLRGEGIDLALDDPGTQVGSTFPIHEKMYEAIGRNDIILIDLSGVRPNVCVEAGYALDHHNPGRLIFLFQPTAQTPNNPAQPDPPFDLRTFRFERIADSGEIPDKLKPHLKAIFHQATQPT